MRKKVIEKERSMEPRASLKAPSKLIACLRIQDCTISQNRRQAATPRERKVQVIENTISAFFPSMLRHSCSQGLSKLNAFCLLEWKSSFLPPLLLLLLSSMLLLFVLLWEERIRMESRLTWTFSAALKIL